MKLDPQAFLDKKTLILGDVNSGKTWLTGQILATMCRQGLGSRIAVIDLVPILPEQVLLDEPLRGVGGRLAIPAGTDLLYLETALEPPRLSSKTEAEAVVKAGRNVARIEALFERYRASSRDILFVNDISFYLQARTAKDLLNEFGPARTIVANGYYGNKLGGGTLSRQERAGMECLREEFDEIIEKKG